MLMNTMSGLVLAGSLAFQAATPAPQIPRSEAKLVWGDVDRDGRVDLFSIDPLGEDLLLRNMGEGRFDDVTQAFGLPGLKHVRSASFGDFDGDGWSDLAIIGGSGKARLLRNFEGKLFEDVSTQVGVVTSVPFESVRFDDFDQDGTPDLVLAGSLGDVLFRNVDRRFVKVDLPRRLLPGLTLATGTDVVGGVSSVTGNGLASSGVSGGSQSLTVGPFGGAIGPLGTPMQGATATAGAAGGGGGGGGGAGAGTGGGGPNPTAGGSQPLVIDREIPPGFSILGPVDAPVPTGYMATGETVGVNGDQWFQPSMANPGPDDIPENRLLAGYSVARDPAGERLFVFGGINDMDEYVTEGFKFDAEGLRNQPISQQWFDIAPMPLPARSNMAAVTLDNLIYAIGGENPTTGALSQTAVYDPLSDMWTVVQALALPSPLTGAVAGAIGDRIYVYGGMSAQGQVQSTLLVADPSSTAGWQVVAAGGITPTSRMNMVGAVFDNKFYAVGGLGGAGLLDVTEVYDPLLNQWERKSPCPTSFQWATITASSGKLLVFGGENPLPIGDVHQYNPFSDQWSARESMITPRSKSVAGRLCGNNYVAAGEEEGPTPMSTPMPVPVNEEYLENQEDKAVYTKM